MATYTCDCGAPATWFLGEAQSVEGGTVMLAADGKPYSVDQWVRLPFGWRWASCDEHVSRSVRAFTGRAFLATRVSNND